MLPEVRGRYRGVIPSPRAARPSHFGTAAFSFPTGLPSMSAPADNPNRTLLAAVRSWAAASLPGCQIRKVKIYLHGIPDPIQLVDSPGNAAAVAQEATSADEMADEPPAALSAILEALEASKRPLTVTMIQIALAKAKKPCGRRMIESILSQLVADGTLTKSTQPPGYRLPIEQ